ncbi:hypothetical protein [Lysobacter auxotrophicus]|uniref:Uncharacterized protein n=1 Tax=Lysobacter auxotrophicus TaxID=2992573 RepID=A0ABM8DDT6_9GAMM|nr:hypothetical protein [Lysobacter auxotrophicus]BDU16739.1 hypothetical protein LA521A_19400 [Lysobacter auxotrophicus]
MIQQLIRRIHDIGLLSAGPDYPAVPPGNLEAAATAVLSADPLDLTLYMEQVWDAFGPWSPNPAPAGPARRQLWVLGRFSSLGTNANPAWDHLGYSYVLENTRAVQILRRVVREYRAGESLGIPSVATQRWLNVSEALLFGAINPMTSWLPAGAPVVDPEAARRAAYHRLLGLDLAFGAEDNRPSTYIKAAASNASFVRLFEELLFELWQAIANRKNFAGANNADSDRIYRIAEELQFVLRSRRQNQMLAREELASSLVLGWIDATLATNTPVVQDLKANATSSANRLKLIGERVGLPSHSKSAEFFSMASELSLFLRTLESPLIANTSSVQVLIAEGTELGNATRRVITEWAAATGKDLKTRAKPVEVGRPRLAAVR